MSDPSSPPDLASGYIIKGGQEGRARLSVLSRVLADSTSALLDRFEPLVGRIVIDAGCGGGDVSFALAERVGPQGRVVGLDMDAEKLDLARAEAIRRGLGNVEFVAASVLDPWPASGAALVHARFLLTHLPDPDAMLAQAHAALAQGGVIAVQDIDYAGQFCDPPSAAFERAGELYVQAARRTGADPFIGRRLRRLLGEAGFIDAHDALVQPFGRQGDVVELPSLTFEAIADTVIRAGLATADEAAQVARELRAFAQAPGTTLSLPRIFQAWARR